MLKAIKLHGVGPVPDLHAELGERLNILTGDNGLGKSFLLDVCFWSLTGTWPGGRVAMPDPSQNAIQPTIKNDHPTIGYEIEGKPKRAARSARDAFGPRSRAAFRTSTTAGSARYNFATQAWDRRGRPPMPGLVVYAAVDGSFAVWDPARNYWREPKAKITGDEWPRAFQFPRESSPEYDDAGKGNGTIRRDVANGLEEEGRVLCNGLIADWGEWFYQRSAGPTINPFRHLEEVLAILSHPLEPLQCGEPRKVFLDDSRKFPTLQMPYGPVPYPQWSAGVKRVVSLAYLIVWSWVEHLQAAALRKENPTDRIILIVDEIEAHLHPKWQRTILPAILNVADKLREDIPVQVLVATHSPLVLASVEPYFDREKDQLFGFNLHTEMAANKMVSFDNLPWAVHGDVVGWLTSDVFGLEQARSREAEIAIRAAEAFLRGDKADLPAALNTKGSITAELKRVLSGLDPFWPRWIVETKR